jgi:hypothetical protein
MMQSSKRSGTSKGDVTPDVELMWLMDVGFNVQEVTKKLALQQQSRAQTPHSEA